MPRPGNRPQRITLAVICTIEFGLALIALAIYTGRGFQENAAQYALGSLAFFVLASAFVLGLGGAIYHDHRERQPGERERTRW